LEIQGISLEFPWKSLEILGKAWRRGDGTLNHSYQLPKIPTAVMAGLVPAIHAAKLIPLLRKSLKMRGFSSCEAVAWRRADDCHAIALGWPGQARP
jgi:hypothetical protein